MILEFRLYSIHEEKIFIKSFIFILSPDQRKSIERAIPSLLRVIKGLKSDDSLKYKVFSISGIYLHFYFESEYIYIIISSLGYKNPVFIPFVVSVKNLVLEVQKHQPIFNLMVNSYFIKKVEDFKNDIEISVENTYKKKKIAQVTESSVNTRKVLVNKTKNKYLVMGAGAAGKSSIISQFFENWGEEQISNIKPTVLSKLNQFEDDYTKESFFIRDLAGQAIYRKKHFEDPSTFEDLRCLIFVIDIQNTKNSAAVKEYFTGILDEINQLNQSPTISIFLHKYDPEIIDKFSSQILFWIEWLENLFEKVEFKDLCINYQLSSIKDNTAREAIARTLLYTLPHWLLGQTVQKELIIKSANSLYPVFGGFQYVLTDLEQKELDQEIFRTSHLFGVEIAKNMVKDWIKFMIKNEHFLKKLSNKEASMVRIRPDESERKFQFCFKCPLKEELKTNRAVCEITHGLFKGLGQLIGFPNVRLIETQIRDNTEECKIEISY